MPNWCNNKITIKGDEVRIANLWSSMKNENNEFCLMGAMPIPETEDESSYEWRITNWGTKWPMDVTSVDKDDTEILIFGFTAWSPPIELLEFISRNWEVDIEISFDEPGMDFAGVARFANGVGAISEGSISEYMAGDVDEEDFDAWHEAWHEALERCLQFHKDVLNKEAVC